MEATIKAIETKYKGYRFRSRLEAKWAIFFDALNIEWEYEPEGFELSDGTYYLPDFYLPTFSGGMYCEVKPIGGDFSKTKQFCLDSGKDVWECEGVPNYRKYFIISRDSREDDTNGFDIFETEGVPNINQAYNENRMYWWPDESEIEDENDFGIQYINAIIKVRSARFEHGENGT